MGWIKIKQQQTLSIAAEHSLRGAQVVQMCIFFAEGVVAMELRQVCWALFQQSGQIGYYLLGCQLEQEKEVTAGGTVSASKWSNSAQSGL